MKLCFDLAKGGEGFVSPNPLVGAVIVKNKKIIGKGYHQEFGKPHAEVNAINSCTDNPEGATLYCNLEPCSHTSKKTLPCVPIIIKCGIKKVVISNTDPNPAVSGKGIQALKDAGLEVVTEIMRDEGFEINRFFLTHIKRKLPYVTLKIARSLDGKIAAGDKRIKITGEIADVFTHSQRSIYDSVLVGRNTIDIDDPELNVRRVEGRNPKRIVIDGELNVNPKSKCFNDADGRNTIIITSDKKHNEKIRIFENKEVNIIKLAAKDDGKLDLKKILLILYQMNIASIFVEGGKEIFSQFINQKLFDELIILQSAKILGKGTLDFESKNSYSLKLHSVERYGDDIKSVFRNKDFGII